jgi:hypothetical protein
MAVSFTSPPEAWPEADKSRVARRVAPASWTGCGTNQTIAPFGAPHPQTFPRGKGKRPSRGRPKNTGDNARPRLDLPVPPP